MSLLMFSKDLFLARQVVPSCFKNPFPCEWRASRESKMVRKAPKLKDSILGNIKTLTEEVSIKKRSRVQRFVSWKVVS